MLSNNVGDLFNGQIGRPPKGVGFGLGGEVVLSRQHAHHEEPSLLDLEPRSGPDLAEELLDHHVEEVGLALLEGEGVVAVDLAVLREPPLEPLRPTLLIHPSPSSSPGQRRRGDDGGGRVGQLPV